MLAGRGAVFTHKPCVSPVCTQSLKNRMAQKTAEVTLQDALPVFPWTKTTAISEGHLLLSETNKSRAQPRATLGFSTAVTSPRRIGSAGVLSAACLER